MVISLKNVRKYLKRDGLAFIVANDKYRIYLQIFNESNFEILDIFNRPVDKRTERSNNRFYESVFMVRKKG